MWVHGYGFPRDLGGPLHWAEHVREGGLAAVLATLERLSGAFPASPHLAPSPLLAACVAAKAKDPSATLAGLCRANAKARATLAK